MGHNAEDAFISLSAFRHDRERGDAGLWLAFLADNQEVRGEGMFNSHLGQGTVRSQSIA